MGQVLSGREGQTASAGPPTLALLFPVNVEGFVRDWAGACLSSPSAYLASLSLGLVH